MQQASDGRLLVIGSSPISLLIALTASRDGYSVTLAERSEQLGGAWACDEVDGQLVDRACHLMEPLAPARRWVFDQLGEEPASYAHPPSAVTPWNSVWPVQSRRYRALEVAMAWPAAARHVAGAIGGDRDEFRRVLAECRHDIGRLTRRASQELWSGPAPAMSFSPKPFARLCDLVAESVDELLLGENVARIQHRADHNDFVASLGGATESFANVVVPSGADIQLAVAGRTVTRRQFRFENHHLLFDAIGGTRPLGYAAFMADQHVRRVANTGPAPKTDCTGVASGEGAPVQARLLAHTRGPEVTVDDVATSLARHNYIDHSEPPKLVRHFRFTSTRTMFSERLPPGLWTPDTYGDLTDNLAKLLVTDGAGDVRLALPFAAGPASST